MEDPGSPLVAILTGAACMFFSLAEGALSDYSLPRLLALARKRDREAEIQAFAKSDERLLLTFRTLSVISTVAFTLAVLSWIHPGPAAPDAWTLIRAGAIAAALLLSLGRMIPRFLGRLFAEEILLHLRPVFLAVHLAGSPLVVVVEGFRTITGRIADRKIEPNGADAIQEEIRSAVEEGEMEGVLREYEADMIERALDLHDADVADVMTPRTEIFGLEISTPLAEAVARISEVGHSRVPVYRENLDDIVGVLYAKDILAHWGEADAARLTLESILRKPYRVPETKKIHQLLEEFKRRKLHIAIVMDEYGGTAGLITIEDILEELVGEIEDEFDEGAELPSLTVTGEGEVEVDGRIHVDDLGEALEVEIPPGDFDTVGGLVFAVLGRIPESGEEFEHQGLHFRVLSADERRVNRVKVVKI